MTRQYCHIGSRTIAYLDSAPGNNDLRALVLLHAFPIGANLWEPQMRSIPKGWRLITPDLRGFGGSTELDSVSALSMADYADDVVDLLRGARRQARGDRRLLDGRLRGAGAVSVARRSCSTAWCWPTRAPARIRRKSRANRRNMLALVDREGPSGVAREMMPKLLGKTTQRNQSDRRGDRAPADQAAVAGRGPQRHPSHDASPRLDAAASSGVGADAGDHRRGR